jgi:hypothetical protein
MGAFTSAALAAASIGTQVYGQYQQGKAAKEAAEYNASVYREQAQLTGVKKELSAYQYDRQIEQLRGGIVTTTAAQQRDLSGSSLLVMIDSLKEAQLDKAIEQLNIESDAKRAVSKAEEYQIKGRRELASSRTEAVGTLLTQGNQWYQQYGGFGKA